MHDLPPALLDAIAFAARAHHGQLRKDGRTPYVSHVFRVCLTVRHLFGVEDPQVLMAAVLHDTIEDTRTDYDDLADLFGPTVADWVAALSKDMRAPDEQREDAYCRTLSAAPWQVRICKLGDLHDNLSDAKNQPPEKLPRTLARSKRYLDALRVDMPVEVRAAMETIASLWHSIENSARASGTMK